MTSLSSKNEPAGGTVSRVLALLSCFAERQEWSITDLAARLSLPKSTIHRLLRLCRDAGFIEAQSGSIYSVGIEFNRVSAIVAAQAPLVRFGLPLIQDIAYECQEVSILAVLVPEKLKMTYLAKADPSEDFRYHIDLNVLKSICWGACGRTMLAYLPEAQIVKAVSEAGASPSGTPFNEASLRSDLESIRKRGYYISRGQHRETAVGVAVPFFGPDGAIKGSIGISIPTFRFRNKMVPGLVKPMTEKARKITYFLGGPVEHHLLPNKDSSFAAR